MDRIGIKTFVAIIIMAITFSLTGCVTTGPQFTIPDPPPSGQSIVYFYRANELLTNATSPGLLHNNKKVLSLMVSGGFWKYTIKPGVHVFEPQQFGLYKKESLTLTNDRPGQTYYVEMVLNIGYIGLKLRSKLVGLTGIADCHELNAKSNDNVTDPKVSKSARTKSLSHGSSTIHVATSPENSRIRIMNIRPKFHQGIEVVPGKYHVEVSADGYYTKSRWVTLSKGEAGNFNFTLDKKNEQIAKTPTIKKKVANTRIKDPRIAEIAQMLASDNPVTKRNAAKTIRKNYPGQEQLLELAGQELEKGHNTLLHDRNHVDAMAWLCKAIGASGSPDYREFLVQIANQTQSRKIKKYALQNAELL
ncbi:MAG: PEGA domain-containing protein [Desulfobulbaceae bacterium]|nr:PEGA domain-containing protein [Desulfobulbaceae bacterium]